MIGNRRPSGRTQSGGQLTNRAPATAVSDRVAVAAADAAARVQTASASSAAAAAADLSVVESDLATLQGSVPSGLANTLTDYEARLQALEQP